MLPIDMEVHGNVINVKYAWNFSYRFSDFIVHGLFVYSDMDSIRKETKKA